jgi:hypothetical protein
MIIRLDAARIDATAPRVVMDHIRGRIIATTLNDFVAAHRLDPPRLRMTVNADAMVWHDRSITDLARVLAAEHEDVALDAHADAGGVYLPRAPFRPVRHGARCGGRAHHADAGRRLQRRTLVPGAPAGGGPDPGDVAVRRGRVLRRPAAGGRTTSPRPPRAANRRRCTTPCACRRSPRPRRRSSSTG